MKNFRKRPVVIKGISFEDFIQFGKEHTDNIVNGMPWSFKFEGYSVTHGSDECYAILLNGGHFINFKKGEILTIQEDGAMKVYDELTFNRLYESL